MTKDDDKSTRRDDEIDKQAVTPQQRIQLGAPHTDAFFMHCVAIRHDASMLKRGCIVTDRNATHQKRIRVDCGAE